MNHTPSPTVSQYPFENVEGNLFPPVCLRSHWNPSLIIERTLPQQKVSLALDPRPLTKVCKEYRGDPDTPAPEPPSSMVFPMGGTFYPPSRYADAIDKESVLRTMDHPLDRWCTDRQYIVPTSSGMYHAGTTVPDRKPISNSFISELSMPSALLRRDTTTCRTDNDIAYSERSSRLFNNPTKMDRYGAEKYYALPGGLPKGEPISHGGVMKVKPTLQAQKSQHVMGPSVLNQGIPVQTSGTSFVGIAPSALAAPVW